MTEGTHERAFTALVYNEVSIGLWYTNLSKLKNHVKSGGLAGRVRAARSERQIETIQTGFVLIWSMEQSQDNGSDTFFGFRLPDAGSLPLLLMVMKLACVRFRLLQ